MSRLACAASLNERKDLCVKYLEIIADHLHDAGWSLGWVATVNLQGRTIWIVDAHGYANRFIVRADEKLTAFLELQRAIHQFAVDLITWLRFWTRINGSKSCRIVLTNCRTFRQTWRR